MSASASRSTARHLPDRRPRGRPSLHLAREGVHRPRPGPRPLPNPTRTPSHRPRAGRGEVRGQVLRRVRHPSGVLTSDQDIKQDRADQLKARWRAAHQGNREIAVLGQGAKFQPVTIPPEQAQFPETTQANVRTICRYFGVQPELIGADSGNSLTYANVEQRALDFLTFGLRPWLVRLETALSALLSSTTTVKFNAAALVRTDLLTRYQAHESAIRAGWKLRSEVRDLEDLPPIAGIDDPPGGAVA
jgi:HK97 family phage portal protein